MPRPTKAEIKDDLATEAALVAGWERSYRELARRTESLERELAQVRERLTAAEASARTWRRKAAALARRLRGLTTAQGVLA
jgi:tryptophan 2,3-dioxygenase